MDENDKLLGSFDETFIYSLADNGGYVAIAHEGQELEDAQFMYLRSGEMMRLAVDIIKTYG